MPVGRSVTTAAGRGHSGWPAAEHEPARAFHQMPTPRSLSKNVSEKDRTTGICNHLPTKWEQMTALRAFAETCRNSDRPASICEKPGPARAGGMMGATGRIP